MKGIVDYYKEENYLMLFGKYGYMFLGWLVLHAGLEILKGTIETNNVLVSVLLGFVVLQKGLDMIMESI